MTDVMKYMEVNPGEAKKLAQRLHIKKDEIQLVRKFYIAEKGDVNEAERAVVARVSTIDRDRDGEIVDPKGIDITSYSKNPCLLWAHRYSDPPIGKAIWAKVDDNGLVCKFQFAKTQFADEIYQLYKEGYLRAFSIGFIPLDYDTQEKIHRKISILEVSAVPVPANENALVMEAYAKGIITSDALKKDLSIDAAPENRVELVEEEAPAEVEADVEKAEPLPEPEPAAVSVVDAEWMKSAQEKIESAETVADLAYDLANRAFKAFEDHISKDHAEKEATVEPEPGPEPESEVKAIPEPLPEPEPEAEPEPAPQPDREEIIRRTVREFYQSGEFKRAVDDAIRIGIDKLRGKVY